MRRGQCVACSRGGGGIASGSDGQNTTPLAIVYIENQTFRDLYSVDAGFKNGTVFRELDFPFAEARCRMRGGRCG